MSAGSLPDRLTSLQALRAIAALAVVVSHLYGVEQTHGGDAVITPRVAVGFAGVDLFFALSGFVMVYTTFHGPVGPAAAGRFLWARIARIYPLWWACAGFLVAALFVVTGLPYEPGSTGSDDPAAFLVKSFLLLPMDAGLPVLPVGWTLMHEMYFYIVFVGFVLAPRGLWPVLAAVWAGLVAAGAALGLSGNMAQTLMGLATHPLTFEFLMGAAAAWLIVHRRVVAPGACVMIGVGWIIAAVLVLDIRDTPSFPFFWERLFGFGPPAALIVYGLAGLELEGGFEAPGVLVTLGDWSYALYLLHSIVMASFGMLIWPLFQAEGPLDNLIAYGAMIALSIAAAGIAHIVFEKPIMRLLRPKAREPARAIAP